MFQSYEEKFDNLFNPKIETVKFQFIEISEKKTIIQPKFAENLQKTDKKTENEVILPKNQNIVESISFPSVIRNVTPKRAIFRRFSK